MGGGCLSSAPVCQLPGDLPPDREGSSSGPRPSGDRRDGHLCPTSSVGVHLPPSAGLFRDLVLRRVALGGGAAVAETARRPTVAAVEEDDPGVCAHCGGEEWWGQHGQFYPCPASCMEQHRTERCSRRNYPCPTFAEFFPEAGQPLTEAMALNRVAVLPAFGPNVNSADDFWSPAGKDKMERMEADPLVAASSGPLRSAPSGGGEESKSDSARQAPHRGARPFEGLRL